MYNERRIQKKSKVYFSITALALSYMQGPSLSLGPVKGDSEDQYAQPRKSTSDYESILALNPRQSFEVRNMCASGPKKIITSNSQTFKRKIIVYILELRIGSSKSRVYYFVSYVFLSETNMQAKCIYSDSVMDRLTMV